MEPITPERFEEALAKALREQKTNPNKLNRVRKKKEKLKEHTPTKLKTYTL
jgi:carbamoylphosphate synthase large subunit